MKLAALALASVLPACAISDLDDENVGVTEQYLKPACDEWGCGMNSPWVDNFGFHSFMQNGAVGEQGLKLGPLVKGGIEYKLSVTDGKIIGTKAGYLPLTAFGAAGPGLIGSYFTLTQNGATKYVIRISDAAVMKSWAVKNGIAMPIETYHLQWQGADKKFYNLCSESTTDGLSEFHAVVYEGDQIDAATKTESTTIDNNLVNIGCAGSTLAKMALIGHTEVAKRAGFSTTINQRTTALKMFAADYCGSGKAFTVGGQPLQYSDNYDWFNSNSGFLTRVEALWNINGAVCLNTPRTIRQPSDLAEEYFSDVEDQIADECQRPPACPADTSATNPSPYHLVSTNQLQIIPL